MSITLLPVEGRRAERTFIDLPWKLYQEDSHWVPPLKLTVKDTLDTKGPHLADVTMKKWLAYRDGECVGRIAAIINERHNRFHQERCGFFGFFETIDDEKVAQALFHQAESYLRKAGMNTIRGPYNPSSNYECGLLVKGFDDPPQLMMSYNKTYYPRLLEQNQFSKAKDLFAYRLNLHIEIPKLLMKAAERAQSSRRIRLRHLNLKNWREEAQNIRTIYNDAWEKNWGFVPMTQAELDKLLKDLKLICDPRLILFAHVGEEPAAFLIALPDYNQVFKKIRSGRLSPWALWQLWRARKTINRARVVILGVRKKFRHLGLAPLLISELQKEAFKIDQYMEFEQSWILEDNKPMNRPLELMQAERYKTYRIYEKALS